MRHGPGIGKQHVDAAQLPRNIGNPRLQCGGVGNIHGRAGRLHTHRLQLGNGAGNLIGVAGAHRDACAFARQRVRNRPPDATRATENDGVPALQTQVHLVFPYAIPTHCIGEGNPGESSNRRHPSRHCARSDWSAMARRATVEAIYPPGRRYGLFRRQTCHHCASAIAPVAGAHSRELFGPLRKRFAFAAGNVGAHHRALLTLYPCPRRWIDATPVFPRASGLTRS